jgi:hypothetical protein
LGQNHLCSVSYLIPIRGLGEYAVVCLKVEEIMPHICKEDNCNNSVFGGGFCSYHQFRRSMKGGDKYRQKKPTKPLKPRSDALSPRKAYNKIPPKSKTRKKEHKYYSQGCKELEQELRDANNGKIYDFFTGLEIQRQVTFHHLLGRSGDYYTDKELLVPAENDENDGHLFWHRATIKQLLQKKWYQSFLLRLKSKSFEAYNKELRKAEKTVNLFGDEENI